MRKPRLLSMILAVVMLLTCCFGTHLATVVAATNTEPTFTVTNGSGSPGEVVTVTVDISNNPGICTATLWLHYDEGLTLKSATDSKLLVGGLFGGDKTANPYGLSWDDSANFDGDNSSNGTLVTLVFTVNETATNGDYNVWVTYNYGDIYNLDFDDFDFECVAGKITVIGGACSHKYTNYVSDGNATCQVDGTKTATCDNGCGTTDTVIDVGSKVAHKYTTYTPNNDATCEGNGTKTASCDFGCGAKDTLIIEDSELGHSYTTYTSDGNATCEADGTKTATCDNGCGKTDTVEDTGSKIPHSFRNYTSNNDSTCFSDGTKTAYCEYGCGEKETVTDTGSKKTHSYTSYTYNNDATYKADGTETASCDHGCGTTDTRIKDGSKLVDSILPTGEIKVKENGWKSFLNTISFGLFCKDKFDVTITAEDNETGIDTVEYYKSSTAISEDNIKDVTGWTSGKSFSVESEGQYIIYVKITDKAGNVAYISTDGIVVDTTAPVIGGIVNGASYCETKNFTVDDAYLDVVTVNGVKTTDYTLTDGEYTIVAADKAGNTVTVTVIVYDGHKFSNYGSNGDATCQKDGTKTAQCDHGCEAKDTQLDVGSKMDHKYTNYVSNGDATCTVDGTKTAKCDYNCGAEDTQPDVGSKIPHKYTNYTSNSDATCTANGTETAKCDYNCGNSNTRIDDGSMLAHKYTNYVSNNDATCDSDGTETAKCDYDCGHKDTRTDMNSKLGHKYTNYVSNNDATCEADGTETATCDNNCGKFDTRTDIDSKLGHKYTNYVSNNDATCQADGTQTAVCENGCGKSDTVADTGSKKDHSYTNYVSNNDATCEIDGTETAACDYNCGKSDTRTDVDSKLGHKYTNYVSNNDATCQADGTRTATCDNKCGKTDTVTDTGSKTNHKYTNYVSNNDATCEENDTETASCDFDCGEKDTRTAEGSKLGHDWELTSTKEATCTEDGVNHYTCKHDTKHTKTETIAETGHKLGEWVVTKPATDKETGEMRRDCENCDYFETKEIPVVVYEVTEGDNAEWQSGSKGELSFKFNGDSAKFTGITVDGNSVDASNYTVSGNTVIALKDDYLNTLSAGKHTLTATYEDGSASAEFEIKAVATDDQNDTGNTDSKAPATGDENRLLFWIVLLCLSGMGLTVTIAATRKRSHR